LIKTRQYCKQIDDNVNDDNDIRWEFDVCIHIVINDSQFCHNSTQQSFEISICLNIAYKKTEALHTLHERFIDFVVAIVCDMKAIEKKNRAKIWKWNEKNLHEMKIKWNSFARKDSTLARSHATFSILMNSMFECMQCFEWAKMTKTQMTMIILCASSA
jgi:hypothetical protein